MKAAELLARIDELYQLPLGEFTAARNKLAKELSGADRKTVKALEKPTVAMWAVNQVYWRDKATYKALIDASEKRRAAHRAALKKKKPADLTKVEAVYRAALQRAIAKAIALLDKSGHPVSEATRDAVRSGLSALPTDEQPGRMSKTPPPAGFSLLVN